MKQICLKIVKFVYFLCAQYLFTLFGTQMVQKFIVNFLLYGLFINFVVLTT